MNTLAHIAAQLQGYDPQAMSVAQVGAFLEQLATPLPDTETEVLPIAQALGRVLAFDAVSPIDVPAHDNSAMDGYAFAHAHLSADADTPLQVVGTALAGQAWQGTVGAGQCVKIMTGAIMPAGLDTVAPQEMTRALADDRVLIPARTFACGDNRRFQGEDVRRGSAALRRGQRLHPAALGLLASLGVAQVSVMRRLRVAYFSTGNEILSLGEPQREGAVYDSNRYTLMGLLTRLGVELIDLGVVPDDPTRLKAAFEQAAAQADTIVTSGGVSVGEADHTKAMMRELGDVAFWRIAMRPGRPMAVGQMPRPGSTRSTILFGLPGNPVAVMVTFLAFVRPALERMMGAAHEPLPLLQAQSQQALRKKPGRTEYQRGIVSLAADGRLQVRTTGQQGSGVLSSMVQANGLIVLPHDSGNVAMGDVVSVMMFGGVI
jgi:molybdopterin molybdotransferase